MMLLMKKYLKNVVERDYIDTHREDSPLVMADDAIEIDNSYLNQRGTICSCFRISK